MYSSYVLCLWVMQFNQSASVGIPNLPFVNNPKISPRIASRAFAIVKKVLGAILDKSNTPNSSFAHFPKSIGVSSNSRDSVGLSQSYPMSTHLTPNYTRMSARSISWLIAAVASYQLDYLPPSLEQSPIGSPDATFSCPPIASFPKGFAVLPSCPLYGSVDDHSE